MKSLIFSESDIRAWQAGEKTLHFLRMKKQPEFKAEGCRSACLETPPVWFDFWGLKGRDKRVKAPFRPGDKIYIRETWRWSSHKNGDRCACYKADNMCQCGIMARVAVDDTNLTWRSPVTMPEWAARYYAAVGSITPAEVGQEWVWIIELWKVD
jgi:hypothetical protein